MGIIPANVDLSCRGGKRVGGEKKFLSLSNGDYDWAQHEPS